MRIRALCGSLTLLLVSGATWWGCGLANQTVSCDFRDGSVNGPEPRCQERTFIAGGEVFAETCKSLEGEAIQGECPTTDRISGCEIGTSPDGTRVVDWYYSPRTQAEVETTCELEGGELVTE